jgi:hypothetical protein
MNPKSLASFIFVADSSNHSVAIACFFAPSGASKLELTPWLESGNLLFDIDVVRLAPKKFRLVGLQ